VLSTTSNHIPYTYNGSTTAGLINSFTLKLNSLLEVHFKWSPCPIKQDFVNLPTSSMKYQLLVDCEDFDHHER
jgi:hypothetical protein